MHLKRLFFYPLGVSATMNHVETSSPETPIGQLIIV